MNRTVVVLLPIILSTSYAYEVDTHEEFTQKAFEQATFVEYLPNIGIESVNTRLAGDISENESNKISRNMSIIDWMKYGAKHEDDVISTEPLRFLNHFYDPTTEKGLNKFPWKGLPSILWGLENTQDIQGQEFSYKDALNYYYRSLTEESKIEREKRLSLTFRTVGNIVHLIQDAAQPQHTRNDSHGGNVFNAGEKSLFEQYNNSKLTELPYEGYLPVALKKPDYYWTTKNGKGIADYSNRGFVTAGTNFDRPTIYSKPGIDLENGYEVDIKALFGSMGEGVPVDDFGKELTGFVTFFRNNVTDMYQGGEVQINDKMTTYSIFSPDLTTYNKEVVYFDEMGEEAKTKQLFTLNRFNFDSANRLLSPRAVGYSAGMMDYFFRARVRSTRTESDDHVSVITKNVGEDPLSGNFELYYNDTNQGRHLLDTITNGSLFPKEKAITPDGSNPTTLTFHITNPPPDLDKDDPYVVVFNGDTTFQENDDGLLQYEPAVTGFVIDNRKLAYAQPSGTFRKMNPETGSAKAHIGQFGGSSRIKKHPINNDLAIVYHPFKDEVQVIDYAANKSASVKMDKLASEWLVAARWLDGNVMVAEMGMAGSNTWYEYKILKIGQDHTLELVGTNRIEVDNGDYEVLGGIRSWGHWPGQASEYFDLAYGPYVNWYSFDILPDGTMITLLNKWGWENTQNTRSETYHTVLNCTNQTLATESSRTTSTFVDMKLQKISLDGSVVNEDLNTHHKQDYVSEYHYQAPSSPQEPGPCYRGQLIKQAFYDTRDWRYVLHLDVKPDEQIAEVVESGTFSGSHVWTSNDGWVKQDIGSKTYAIDGQQVDTGMYLLLQNASVNIEEDVGVQFWDLQYDKNGRPYAIWVKERWWFDEPNGTYHHDTALNFGSTDKHGELLSNRHDYFEFGPPLEVADVVVDPYRDGVLAVVKVRDSSFYDEFAYDVDTAEFVRYEGKSSVDLRQNYQEEFAGVTNLQFLP